MRGFFRLLTITGFALTATVGAFGEDDLLPLPPPPAALGSDSAASTSAAPAASDTGLDLPAAPPPGSAASTPAPTSSLDTFSFETPAPAVAVSSIPSGGVPGRITGGRVNLRAGNSTKYEIVVTVNPDTPVTVYGKNGEWVQIGYPSTEFAYMSTPLLEGDVPAEIPALGLQKRVNADRVAVRVKPWPGSKVVGYLSKGETVTVTGVRGGWVRIQPPASARAWVFGTYVTYQGDVQMAEASPLESEKNAPAVSSSNNKLAQAAAKSGMGHQNPMDTYRAIADRERKQLEDYRKSVNDEVVGVEETLKRIEEEAEREKQAMLEKNKAILQPLPKEDLNIPGKYSGWIEYVGFIGKRPAAFRLVKGGQVMFLLRSAKYDLAEYQYKRVLVSGRVEMAPGWEANILVVDQLDLLGTSSSGVMKTPSRTYGEQQPVAPSRTYTPEAEKDSDADNAPAAVPHGGSSQMKSAPLKIEPPVESFESRYER